MSSTSIVFLLYAPYYWVIGNSYSKWSASLYASTCQTIWCLCVAWVIFACVNGFGGFVDTFLSLKLFRPISRIIYMTFLTHGQILIIHSGTRNKLLALESSNLVCPNLLSFCFFHYQKYSNFSSSFQKFSSFIS